jgi:hypothetical protein
VARLGQAGARHSGRQVRLGSLESLTEAEIEIPVTCCRVGQLRQFGQLVRGSRVDTLGVPGGVPLDKHCWLPKASLHYSNVCAQLADTSFQM